MTPKTMRCALYARVSTADKGQDPEMQLSLLRNYCAARGWTIVGEFVDKGISGAKDKRPALNELMDLAKKRQIDCIAVFRLDRWGRSLKHLINSITELQDLGISFVSYSENLDFSTPAGTMMFHVIGAMSEFQRAIIVENVRAGIENARRKGRRLGRRPAAPIDKRKVLELRKQGLTYRAISKKTKLSVGLVHKIVGEMGAENGLNT